MRLIWVAVTWCFFLNTASADFSAELDDKIKSFIFPEKSQYNKALSLYEDWYYSFALDNFSALECENVSGFCADVSYNLWRVKYDLAKDLKRQNRINMLEKSLKDFKKSKLLRKGEDTQTNQNIEILEALIEKEKKEEEKRKQEEKKNEEKRKSNQNKWENQKPEWAKREKWEDYSKNKEKELNEFQRNMIERYSRNLRDEEKKNQEFYWKQFEKSWNPFSPSFYKLFNKKPQNKFDTSEKKDW